MAKKTNVLINGKEYYRVTKTVGHKADGTAIRKTFYGVGKKEAEEKAEKYLSDIKNGLIFDFEYATIADLMHTWLFEFLHNSSKLKPSTFARYEGIYRKYIKNSDIAGNKLHSFNSVQLQIFYNNLSKKYRYTQINTLNTVLKIFFNWCIDNGYILKNPCLKVNIKGNKTDIINNKKKDVKILTEKEIKLIKEHIKGSNYELLILLDFATGLRQGELLALDWEHVDLKNKTLFVERSVKEVYVYDNENSRHIETIFQTPKTEKSIRFVPIPNVLIDVLNKIPEKEGLLFHDKNGQPLRAKNVADKWKKILKECKIPHTKFHAIRHTYGSTLLKNGVDIETVAELMGHTAISITQIYLHSSTEQKHEAVNKINYLF